MATQDFLADTVARPCQHSLQTHSCLQEYSCNRSPEICEDLKMYTQKLNEALRANKQAGTATPKAQQLQPPPERPTINTALARGHSPALSYAAVAAGAVPYSPSTASATNTTQSGFYTPATSLVAPITAHTEPSVGTTQSALIPRKPSWETALTKKTGLSPNASTFVAKQTTAVEMPSITRPKSPRAPGLQFGSFPATGNTQTRELDLTIQNMPTTQKKHSANANVCAAAHPVSKPDLAINSTIAKNKGGKDAPKTCPLPHQGFGASGSVVCQPRPSQTPNQAVQTEATRSHTDKATHSFDTPESSHAQGDSDGYITNPYDSGERPSKAASDGMSEMSVLTTHYTITRPDLDDVKPQTWDERPHKGSFRTVARTHGNLITDAMPRGRTFAEGTNPANFKMDLGARVLCIKTDALQNIYTSLTEGVWAATEKIGRRVNRVWEARRGAHEIVLLLFSVNGQKCYCGMAIMRSPWKPGEVASGFLPSATEAKPEGSCQVEWVFVKNVAYEHFNGITHPRNKQSIVNMWNGMHFPYQAGRTVIEKYVKTPHFTNILCYRQDQQYNPFKDISHGAQLDPTLRDKATRPVPPTPAAGGKGASTSATRGKGASPQVNGGKVAATPATHGKGAPTPATRGKVAATPSTRGRGSGRGSHFVQHTRTASPYPSQGNQIATLSQAQQGPRVPEGNWSAPDPRSQSGVNNAIVYETTPPSFDGVPGAAHQPGTIFVVNENYALVPYVPPTQSIQPVVETHPSYSMAHTPRHTYGRSIHPQQPASFQAPHRGHGNGHPYPSYRGGSTPVPQRGNSHHFTNVGNARMQHFPTHGGMTDPMHNPHFSGYRSPNYMHGQPAVASPQNNQAFPAQSGMDSGVLTRDNLRNMQSMSNLRSGQSTAQNGRGGGHILRHAASASEVFEPGFGVPEDHAPITPDGMRSPGTGVSGSPLTPIPYPESQSPAPHRKAEEAEKERVRIMERAIEGFRSRYPSKEEETGVEGEVEVEVEVEGEDALSDDEEGGVALE